MIDINQIKNIRKKYGMTQHDLAKKANVSQSMIAKIEAGILDPSYTKVQKIFEALESVEKSNELKAKDIMNRKIISLKIDDTIKTAISKMKKFDISQMVVMNEGKPSGLISESIILDSIMQKKIHLVGDIMQDSPPVINENTTSSVITNLLKVYPIVLVNCKGKICGVITKADLIEKMYS